jgi:hypothetical protein
LTAWLRDRAGLSGRQASQAATVAKRLRQLPVTADAWTSGTLSGGQVDAICANVSPATVELFADHEAGLVPTLAGMNVQDTATVMRAWKAAADTDGTEPVEPERSFYLSPSLGGQWAVGGSLDPHSGHELNVALRVAQTDDVEGEPARTPGQRRADALIDICRYFLDHQQHRRGGRHRPHVNVVVDLADFEAGRPGHYIDGDLLDPARLHTLLCDSAIHRVITSGRSAILDYGTSTRTIPAPLWNALVIRDEHCRFPGGCDRPPEWCHGHHVTWVTQDGPTRLDNLVLLCSRHHHRLHQPGWHAKLQPDGTLEITDPTGQLRTTSPPRAGPTLW